MMNNIAVRIIIKNSLLLALAAAFAVFPNLSRAEVSFQPASPSISSPTDILNNLPAPLNEFINSAKNIGDSINSQFGRYITSAQIPSNLNVNINQISRMNLSDWLNNAFQSGPLAGVYSIVIQILQLAGNIALWVLGIITELIRQGLSLIHQ